MIPPRGRISPIFLRKPSMTKFVDSLKPAKDAHMTIEDKTRCALIDYTNWRGERRLREVRPIELEFAATKWHPITQWMLRAKDLEDGKVKHFALTGIHAWNAVKK